MTERDAFELRLAAAVRGYAGRVSSDLDPVELAHRIAAAEPRRHAFAAALGWRRVAIPRRAWVLLLAALLTAMVAGMLVVGSQPVRKLPAVVPPVVPAFACPPRSTPDEPGPVDQARPSVYRWSPMAFDRRAGKLIALAGADTRSATVETWTFDVCTNTWAQMHPSREPPAQVRSLVYDLDSDLTVGVHSEDWHPYPVTGNAWAYDLQANTWTEKGAAPTDEPAFYDPVSGLVVAGGRAADEWNYDVETDTWTPIRDAIFLESLGATQYAYDISVDRIVMHTTGGDAQPETWLFDLRSGAWSRSGAETPAFTMGMWAEPGIIYDEAAARTVVAANNRWGAYDAAGDLWEILFDAETDGSLPLPSVYDPVNQRLIVFGGWIGVSGDLVAFDLVTREWTVLLEPGGG